MKPQKCKIVEPAGNVRVEWGLTALLLLQIRHMVAAAVQVARGKLPLAFVQASLRRPSRAAFPLAPSQVLQLHLPDRHDGIK